MELFPPLFHGTLREHYLLLFGVAGGIALVTGLVSAWVGAYVGARRAAPWWRDRSCSRGPLQAIDAGTQPEHRDQDQALHADLPARPCS